MIVKCAIAVVIFELVSIEYSFTHHPPNVQSNKGKFGSTFPGTLWCGPGNTAKSQRQLGPLKYIDQCCRQHDGCQDVIPKFSGKHGLFNPTMSPKYNCSCDKEFRDCLKGAPKYEARGAEFIGSLYFESTAFPNCFTHDFPKTCVDKSKITPWRCNTYKNASTRKKTWQWVDYGNWFTDFAGR